MAIRSSRWGLVRWLIVVAGMIVLGVLIAIGANEVQDTKHELRSTQSRLDRQEAASKALADQLEAAGEKPVIDPDDLPDDLPDVAPAIPQDQLELAVAAYCTDNYPICVGPQGKPGEPGKHGTNGDDGLNVTPEIVAAAVATYCDPRGECIGPMGTPGQDGSTGPRGPPPTDEQVLAAVATFCDAHDGCRGPQGDTGPVGPVGPAGPAGPEGPRGEQGPQGQPGPTCPAGWHTEQMTVLTIDDGTRNVLACVADDG